MATAHNAHETQSPFDATLTVAEANAVVRKYRTNRYGNVSPSLVGTLILLGLVDARSRRLTEAGCSRAERIIRARERTQDWTL